jgi:hypothetical protein
MFIYNAINGKLGKESRAHLVPKKAEHIVSHAVKLLNPSAMISSIADNCLPASVCPQHTHTIRRTRVCSYRSSHTTLITRLFSRHHTHLVRPMPLCYFGSSQTIHLTELYAAYHTQVHLATRFCSSASSPIVFTNQLYATYRTRTSFLNRI